jgi:formate/nitrite transporter FocA (FNT family)
MSEPEPEDSAGLDARERQDVEEHQQLPALVIYEAVRQQGQDELERPATSLWWSGLAAGLGMGFSLAAEGAIRSELPDVDWRPLVECFGYAAGFLIVILSRQQLFTENTLSAMLPVLHPPMGRHAGKLARLWSIVLLANLLGIALFAASLLTPMVSDNLRDGMLSVARELRQRSTPDVFWRAIPAGWLVATLVWMLPSAETAKIWVIIAITYLISLFQLTHVVAGAAEVFLLMFKGELDVGTAFGGLVFPMLAGNIIGGSVLFAMLSFGQVKDEIG